MTGYEFIFSDQRRHRITRHVIFWLCWWIAYSLFFHIPVLELKGWGFHREAIPNTLNDVEQIGPFLYALKILVFNSLLAIVLPQAILTYVLLYWILPDFFYRKKNPLITAAVIATTLLVFRFVAIIFLWFVSLGNYVFGLPYKMRQVFEITNVGAWSSLRQQLGSLPVLIGFAVMITLIKRWWVKQKETEEVAREKTMAELQLLKAQVHPHFLFNTLNNIYFFTLSGSPKATEMINKLSGLLRYILNECNQPLVPLEKEIKMIQDYISLEEIRYGEDMKMTVELPGDCSDKMIAPLLLIPFIENSFKHGTSKMLAHPYVNLRMSEENSSLHFYIRNSRPDLRDHPSTQGNIGLNNVKMRLQLLYPYDHELDITEEPGCFSVYLKIKLTEPSVSSETNESFKQAEEYAVV